MSKAEKIFSALCGFSFSFIFAIIGYTFIEAWTGYLFSAAGCLLSDPATLFEHPGMLYRAIKISFDDALICAATIGYFSNRLKPPNILIGIAIFITAPILALSNSDAVAAEYIVVSMCGTARAQAAYQLYPITFFITAITMLLTVILFRINLSETPRWGWRVYLDQIQEYIDKNLNLENAKKN